MKFFVNDSVLQNKNDWWTRRPGPSEKWKKLLLFKNEEKITNDINRSNKQIFQKILTCTIVFYWTNDFLEQTLKKIFFIWTNDFTERSFTEKTNEINGKWTILLGTNEIIFFNDWKKNYRTMGRSQTINERNEKVRTRASLVSSKSPCIRPS